MITPLYAAIQRSSKLSVLVIAIITLLLSQSCSEDKSTNPGQNNSVSATLGQNGGTITMSTNSGNTITLTIPAGALAQPTTISLEALSSCPTNPIATHLFTGVRITPDSLKLKEPAILRVRFGSGPPPVTTTLICFKNPDLVLPLGNDTLYESTVEGEIYHFSDYGGCDPTSSEGLTQSDRGWNSIPDDPMDWWHVYENTNAMEKWAEMLDDPWDMPEDAQQLRDKISDIVEQVASRFLDQPAPDPPCDDPAYILAFCKFQALVIKYVDGDLGAEFDSRLEDIASHCFYDGTIEYGHHFIFSYSSYYEVIDVTGSVPFHINPYYSESNAVYGGGSTHDAFSGTADDCTITGSGENHVILSGSFLEDIPGSQHFQVDFDESWYVSSILTLICPDEDPESNAVPPTHDTFSIEFPFHDGYVEQQPFIGQGGTGTYTWTLHITHQPE
jgi:hypothetical protein